MPKTHPRKSSVAVARVLGVEIRLHWTFLALVLLVVWANAQGGARAIGDGLLWIVAVFGSVLIHELAHCVVARRRGVMVLDILLTPIGGMSQMDRIPERAADEFAIAIVGPLTSFGLALGVACFGLAFGATLWPPTLFAGSWFARIIWLNVLLGAFNFLPALPMDGGRVLRAGLARKHDRRSATQLAARVALVFAVMMMIVGFFYDLWLIVIGMFVFLGARAEEQAAQRAGDDGTIGGGFSGPQSPPARGSPMPQ